MTVCELKILLSNYPDSAKVYNSGEKELVRDTIIEMNQDMLITSNSKPTYDASDMCWVIGEDYEIVDTTAIMI